MKHKTKEERQAALLVQNMVSSKGISRQRALEAGGTGAWMRRPVRFADKRKDAIMKGDRRINGGED